MPTEPTITPAEFIPASEQIVDYLVDLLAGITLDNGYSMDVRVERHDEAGNAKGAANGQGMIVVREEAAVREFASTPITLDGYRMTVGIICFVKNKRATSGDPSGRVLARVTADVIRRLDTDYQLGGLAVNTVIGTPSNVDRGKIPAVEIPLAVLFWTKRNDPFTAYKDIT